MHSFVYEWTNKINNKKYIGKHVGKLRDNIIGENKYFKEDYLLNPNNFYYRILWQGDSNMVSTYHQYYIYETIKQYELYNNVDNSTIEPDLYEHCKQLHKTIERSDKTKYVTKRKMQILKEYCLKCNYPYPY